MSFIQLESSPIPGPHSKAKFPGHYTLVICHFLISEIFCFNNKQVTMIGKKHILVPPQPEQSVEYIHRACSIEWPHCTTPSGRDQTLPSTFPLFFLCPLPENHPPVVAWVNMQPGLVPWKTMAEQRKPVSQKTNPGAMSRQSRTTSSHAIAIFWCQVQRISFILRYSPPQWK